MDDADLAGLIARAKAGEEAAIRSLLETFENDVRMMVRVRLPRTLRSQFDSMDFVQAVWQSVFTGSNVDLERFTNVPHFRAFLAGVARNKVYEVHRQRTRTQKYDMSKEEPLYVRKGNREIPREVPAHDPTPSQDAQASDLYDKLIAGRSDREKSVLDLRRKGLTFDEIAAQTGLNERTVRRIIEALRQRMEEPDP